MRWSHLVDQCWESHRIKNKRLPRSCSVQMQLISADEQRIWTNATALRTHPSNGTFESIDSLTTQGDETGQSQTMLGLARYHDIWTR